MINRTLFTQPTPESVALRLRQLRKKRGLSLQDVETSSRGAIKAVVLGSYERGDRALSLKRAIEIATFYGIPVSQLLMSAKAEASGQSGITIVDLRRLITMGEQENPNFEALLYFVRSIAELRSDWNGEVMSLRMADLEIMALMARTERSALCAWLSEERLLLK